MIILFSVKPLLQEDLYTKMCEGVKLTVQKQSVQLKYRGPLQKAVCNEVEITPCFGLPLVGNPALCTIETPF